MTRRCPVCRSGRCIVWASEPLPRREVQHYRLRAEMRRAAPVLAAAERWERAWAAWDSDLSTPSTVLAAEVRSAAEALAAAVRARRGT